MAKNVGKIFEEQWKKSTPDYALLYRLPDAAQSFGGSNKLRFSSKNPFDFFALGFKTANIVCFGNENRCWYINLI